MAITASTWTLPTLVSRCVRSPIFWWSLLGAWAALICALSTIPGSSMPQIEIANFDKVEHTSFFSGGAFFLYCALASTFPAWTGWSRLVLTVAGISLFGRLDEWHQSFTPGRSGNDFYDWLSDTVGAMIGASLARWLFHHVWTQQRFGIGQRAD